MSIFFFQFQLHIKLKSNLTKIYEKNSTIINYLCKIEISENRLRIINDCITIQKLIIKEKYIRYKLS